MGTDSDASFMSRRKTSIPNGENDLVEVSMIGAWN
jgi:hypothetical protein